MEPSQMQLSFNASLSAFQPQIILQTEEAGTFESRAEDLQSQCEITLQNATCGLFCKLKDWEEKFGFLKPM